MKWFANIIASRMLTTLSPLMSAFGFQFELLGVVRKALPVQRRMLMSAPELLVVCFRMRKPLKGCKTLFDLNSFASVWACIENILLAMAAEGLYGVTKIPYETANLKKKLGVPEDYEVAAIIPIGYPQKYFVNRRRFHC